MPVGEDTIPLFAAAAIAYEQVFRRDAVLDQLKRRPLNL